MNDVSYIFINLRFIVNESIDCNVYSILRYLTEWPMLVGEKPEVYENDFFRNEDWAEFFAYNGTVTLSNFMAYEEMGVQKVFMINSYVPESRKNTVFYFVKWLTACLETGHQEHVLGYIDNGDSSCEIITGKRALPIDFIATEIQ